MASISTLARTTRSTMLSFRPSRLLSTTSKPIITDASKLISNVQNSDLETNPALREYMEANFPDFVKSLQQSQSQQQDEREDEIPSQYQKPKPAKREPKRIDITPENNIRPLKAYLRTPGKEEGSRNSLRMRERDNLVPGILYGADPTSDITRKSPNARLLVKTPWNELQRELDRFTYWRVESRVYDLSVYSSPDSDELVSTHRVVPSNLNFHPYLNKVYCCNYLRYHPGRPLRIPIAYVNEEESPALKRGGFINPIERYVTCFVEDGARIPEEIELDCTGLVLKDVVRWDRLVFPEGVRVGFKREVDRERFLVGTVFGRRSEIGDGGDGVGDGGEEGGDKEED